MHDTEMMMDLSKSKEVAGLTVGLIGLGLMGTPMAQKLSQSGAMLRVWNRNQSKSSQLATELDNVNVCKTPCDVSEGADVTILMLTDAEAVDEVVFGAEGNSEGLANNLKPGSLLIDMGTTSVLKTHAFATKLEMSGSEWVDAPVSGGTTAAESGTLTIMVGGSNQAFKKALPWLQILGERITHVGATGAGQIAKSANQMIVGLTIGAVAEAFTLADANGVEPAKIREALFGGFAHSRILELHGERMIKEDFQARAKCSIQRKDIKEAIELASASNCNLPSLETNLKLWDYMIEENMGDLDHSALLLAISGQKKEAP